MEPSFKPLLLWQIKQDSDVVDGGYGDNDDGSDKGGDNGYVDDGSRGDNGLFQEALINARERGFRISYSLNPC